MIPEHKYQERRCPNRTTGRRLPEHEVKPFAVSEREESGPGQGHNSPSPTGDTGHSVCSMKCKKTLKKGHEKCRVLEELVSVTNAEAIQTPESVFKKIIKTIRDPNK